MKPDGTARPTSAPEALRRIVGKAVCTQNRKLLAEALGDQQFAVGVANGAELLARCLEVASEMRPEFIWFKLDKRNAHTMQYRAAALKEAEAAVPALAPAFNACYARGSDGSTYIFIDDNGQSHDISYAAGVDQGDPFAMALYCFGEKPRLAELRGRLLAQVRPGDTAFVWAFADDTYVGVPPYLAADVFQTATEAFLPSGGELRHDKTQVWSRTGVRPEAVPAAWWCPDGLQVLGSPQASVDPLERLPVGTPAFVSECFEKANVAAQQLASRIVAMALRREAMADAQGIAINDCVHGAQLLLRTCVESRLSHFSRRVPAPWLAPLHARADTAIQDAFCDIVGVDSSNLSYETKIHFSFSIKTKFVNNHFWCKCRFILV